MSCTKVPTKRQARKPETAKPQDPGPSRDADLAQKRLKVSETLKHPETKGQAGNKHLGLHRVVICRIVVDRCATASLTTTTVPESDAGAAGFRVRIGGLGCGSRYTSNPNYSQLRDIFPPYD